MKPKNKKTKPSKAAPPVKVKPQKAAKASKPVKPAKLASAKEVAANKAKAAQQELPPEAKVVSPTPPVESNRKGDYLQFGSSVVWSPVKKE